MKQQIKLLLASLSVAALMIGCGDDSGDGSSGNGQETGQDRIQCGETTCDPNTQECKDNVCVNKESGGDNGNGSGNDGGSGGGDGGDDACPAGQVTCDGRCVNLQNNQEHCGKCGQACSDGVCTNGECKTDCSGKICDGACVEDINTNTAHCGNCETSCQPDQVCSDGSCKWDCKDGKQECSDGCFDIQTDADHCGGCDIKCNSDGEGEVAKVCVGGICQIECNGTLCGDECVNTNSDVNHCGGCGAENKCQEGEVCNNGNCEAGCPQGQERCGDTCVDLSDDNDHCGSCTNVCDAAAGQGCDNGTCVAKCGDNETICDGNCFNLKQAKEHCGNCETQCQGEDVCNNGTCGQKCTVDGEIACDGSCVDLKTNREHCGDCDTKCGDTESCVDGACVCPSGLSACSTSSNRESVRVCVDPKQSEDYCGCTDSSPGSSCATLAGIAEGKCVEGVCEIKCDSTHKSCDNNVETGCETDISTTDNCGECGNACSSENASKTECVLGVCKPSCNEGYTDCNGVCMKLDSDDNCGYCGNKCGEGSSCTSEGFCQIKKCGDDGYVSTKIQTRDGEKPVRAYCIKSSLTFGDLRTLLNTNKDARYPDVYNTDNAYILMADVTFGQDEKDWTPIGTSSVPFKGYFLGNGHTVKGKLKYVGSYAGLFGYVQNSTLDGFNLKLDFTVSGDSDYDQLGALVGHAEDSLISHNAETGIVTGDQTVGGLIGFGQNLTVEMNRVKKLELHAKRNQDGGLIGDGKGVQIKTAEVDVLVGMLGPSDAKYIGGVAGRLTTNSSVDKVTVDMNVNKAKAPYKSSPSYVGGAVGRLEKGSITNSSVHYVDDMVKWRRAGLVCELANSTIDNCSTTGSITGTRYLGGLVSTTSGTSKITNSRSSIDLKTTYGNSSSTICIGGLVADSSGLTIENSHATGNVDGTGIAYAGGLVGRMTSNGKLSNVSASGNVKASFAVGGLVGYISDSTIEFARASGIVEKSNETATWSTTPDQYYGGLVGYMSNTTVVKSFATGNVTGGNDVGGLVGGMSNSGISFSQAFGTANGTRVGALVGTSSSFSSVTSSASIGDAKGTDAGALIGYVTSGTNSVKDSYGTGEVTGARNFSVIVGRIDSGNSSAVSLKKAYYWKAENATGNVVANGAAASGSRTIAFKYNDSKESVLDEDDSKALSDAMGNDWAATKCKLTTGPGAKKVGEYVIPILKVLGSGVCPQ